MFAELSGVLRKVGVVPLYLPEYRRGSQLYSIATYLSATSILWKTVS